MAIFLVEQGAVDLGQEKEKQGESGVGRMLAPEEQANRRDVF
jgi:hypothetical protein